MLQAVAETYYKLDLNIEVKESQIKFDTVHVSFQVHNTLTVCSLSNAINSPDFIEVLWAGPEPSKFRWFQKIEYRQENLLHFLMSVQFN